ncbi:hypothetical protein M409DRAFT_18471 [Zasmidium cellare ATCC 36951]|uniref:Uncharacterized protein n=1 Tax=Zasmidium cellare ATCC 36951 TaxID=1080233 RepID=A0A6A6CWF3_ZASCE|nr:uncharacterized protein M409DRAFT_18471 [Zasmidium cellare ATCC 36951]KAF2171355.1 hypothetical protein M409DRAFT_18471 [Zasmidium cellare ATCC 36951]
MKTTTITALLGLTLSVSAAPSLKKRLNHPDIPKAEAAIVQQPTAETLPTDPLVSVWLDGPQENQTAANAVEIFVTGPAVDPKNVSSAAIGDWAVAILELSDQVGSEAAPSSESDPVVTVWAEGPVNGTNTLESTAVDVFITRPETDGSEVTTGDLREIAVGILKLAKKAEVGEAPRPGPYVPGWSGSSFGGLTGA